MDKSFILKASLFEHGIKISDDAKRILDAQSDIWLMDDYITCSGVTLKYDNEYATVGIEQDLKYELVERSGKLFILGDENNEWEVSVITPPDYMKDKIKIGGKTITNYVNTYTDRIRIQTMCGCANSCKFCNAREFGYHINDIESIDKAFKIALEQSNASHAFISTNNVRNEEDFIKLTNIFEFFSKKYSRMNLQLMTSPRGFTSYTDSAQYKPYLEYLKKIGIKGLSVNLELNSVKALKRFCPEKAVIGQENYLKFIKYAIDIFGKNHVQSLLIVGLEPLEETLKGVEKLAKLGCNPVLSPLFPYGEANTPPNAELFIQAKARSEEICNTYGIKIGPLCKPCSHNVL